MARKQTPITEIDNQEVAPEVAQAAADIQNTVAELQAVHSEDRDLLNQLLGQAKMADAFAKFSKTVLTSKLAFVKENKLYKGLAGTKSKDGLELSGTWGEFCNMLGFTPEHANESINNLREFGEEALESMSSMGIGYREMRQFRRLPEDEKTALIEVAKSGDKEALVEFAETIFEKHSKEKDALEKELDEAKKDLAAKEVVANSNAQRINELQEKVARIKKEKPDETQEELRSEAANFAMAAELSIRGNLRSAIQALRQYEHETRLEQGPFIAGLFGMCKRAMAEIQAEYDVSETTSEDDLPAWLREDSDSALDSALQESQQ